MTSQDFIAKLKPENKELVTKFEACKTPEAAYAVAKAEGLTDNLDVFVAEMKKLNEAVKDLSDDDLANVAGGTSTTEIVTAVSACTSAAATAASAAAA